MILLNNENIFFGCDPVDRGDTWLIGNKVIEKELGMYTSEVQPPEPAIIGAFKLTDNGWLVIDEEAISPPEQIVVPKVITKRQAKQQLVISGLYNQVQLAIDSITDDQDRLLMQIYWDDSQEFERNHPQLISLGYSIGLTEKQIDDLFISASKL